MCQTKRSNGPCVFPFYSKAGGKLYYKCTKDDWPFAFGRTWCATKVYDAEKYPESENVMIDGEWGVCGNAKRCSGKRINVKLRNNVSTGS